MIVKDELNTYGILNSDGVAQPAENEGRVSFDNDKRGFIRESVTADQGELSRVTETFDDPIGASEDNSPQDLSQTDLSSASSASSSASASSSSASAASASVGGGVGALAGVAATSVVAAAVVVAAFVSSLVISLSLVMANMYSLVFGVTLTGADERDFETPIYAVLTGDGVTIEQEVHPDTALLTFDGLEPGKEYRLTVKNAEKIFTEITACTTTEPNDKGQVVSSLQGTDVFVTVKDVKLGASEYYTLVAKDAQGLVLFSKDGVAAPAEYSFKLDKPKDVYFYLTVSGKTYALSEVLLPDYDFDKGVWNWADDYSSVTASFPDKRGGESLVLEASVTRKKTDPTCEEAGSYAYTAKVTYDGKTYTCPERPSVSIPALEHEYVISEEDGQMILTCTRCGDRYAND